MGKQSKLAKQTYLADITKEYEAKINDPEYANELDSLEHDYNFAVLNFKINQQFKGTDKVSKIKALDLKINSGLYSNSEIRKMKKERFELSFPFHKAFGLFQILSFILTLVIGACIITGFLRFMTINESKLRKLTNTNSVSELNDSEINTPEKVQNDALDFALKEIENDPDFANATDEAKDAFLQEYMQAISEQNK